MSDLGSVSAAVMLLFGGLAAGAMLVIAIDRLDVWDRMSTVEYSVDFRRVIKHVDPMMPIMVVLSGIGAAVFGIEAHGIAATLAWIALALIVMIVVASVVLAEPVNSKFRRLEEGTPPEGAVRFRVFWRRFHLVRTVVAVLAFAALVAATVAGLRS